MSEKKPSQMALNLFAEEAPVKTYPLQEIGKAWLEQNQGSGLNTLDLLAKLGRDGLYGKMYQEPYTATGDAISELSSWDWMNAGIMSHGEFLTLSIAEYPNAAAESFLSDILETETPQKYYLSAKAIQGILRRHRKRGNLDESLERLLEAALELSAPQGKPMRGILSYGQKNGLTSTRKAVYRPRFWHAIKRTGMPWSHIG